MKRANVKRALLWLTLSFGLGSALTLFSYFYPTPDGVVFMDEVPIAYNSLRVGYPFPVFASYAELWKSGDFSADARFIWGGALLDMISYTFVVFGVTWVARAVVRDAIARSEPRPH